MTPRSTSGQNPKPGIKPLYCHLCALGPWASHFSLICTYTSGGFTHNAFQAGQGLDKCWLVEGPLAEHVDFWDFLEPTLLVCEVDLELWSLLTPLRPNPSEQLPSPPHASSALALPSLPPPQCSASSSVSVPPPRFHCLWFPSIFVCQELCPRGTNTPGLFCVPFSRDGEREAGNEREKEREERRGGKKNQSPHIGSRCGSLSQPSPAI